MNGGCAAWRASLPGVRLPRRRCMHEKELERLARRLAEGLRGEHDALGREVVRLLACGHPVTPERLASALQMTAEQVAGVLAGFADLEVDQGGNILGWGLTLIPTPH